MTEKIEDELSPAELKIEVLRRTSNCCCICLTPFIHIHHLDFDRNNNVFDNLAPLCPNHHALAHSKSNMYLNLTQERIKVVRDKWYEYVEQRKQSFGINLGDAKLKVKNFVVARPFTQWANPSWAKMFKSLDPSYEKMNVSDIIDRVFSTSNQASLKCYLETMKNMYSRALLEEENKKQFKEICNAFGFDFDGENVE